MERKGEWEYVEQRAKTTKTEKWKEQMCFSYSQMKKLWGKEDDMQTRVLNWIKIQDDVYGYM